MKKFTRKKKLTLFVVLPALLIAALVLVFWRRSMSLSNGKAFGAGADDGRVVLTSAPDVNVSYGQDGFFYTEGNLLKYYDLDAEQSYVLCSKPNCLHSSSSCNAYFPTALLSECELVNAAEYNGKVYCASYDVSSDAYAVYQVDPNDGTRSVVASWSAVEPAGFADADATARVTNSCLIQAISGGYAWLCLHQNTNNTIDRQGSVLCGVSLATGEVAQLADEVLLTNGDNVFYNAICSDYIFYETIQHTEPCLTMQEYYADYGEGGATINGISFDDYSDYETWWWDNVPTTYTIYAYNIATDGTSVLESHTLSEPIDGYGMVNTFKVYGCYEGKALCGVYEVTESGEEITLYLRDIASGEMTLVRALGPDGSLSMIALGYASVNLIQSDGTILVQYRLPAADEASEETIDLYRLSLDTGELKFLYNDSYHGTFRIHAEWNGGYYGRIYKEYEDGADLLVYWISKEDYDAGNLDAAVCYNLG